MNISNLKIAKESGKVQLSADVDGFNLWYRFPSDVAVMETIEPFLASSFLIAIAHGGELNIAPEFPISTSLRENLDDLQLIYRTWNYEFKPVTVNCTTASPSKPVPGVATMYSAGVDSMCTLLAHKDTITHMVRIFGYSFIDTPENIMRTVEHDRDFAAKIGKEYIAVETNVREFSDGQNQYWDAAYGFPLYAVSLALGFERVYFPSNHTAGEVIPDGSHPLTDPLWSNGQTEIVHDVGIRRSDKIKQIIQDQSALDNLHVCWRHPIENCGNCSKCIRTMLTLKLLGETSQNFPELSLKELKKMRISSVSGLTFIVDNLLLAEESQDWEVHRILKKIIHRYQLMNMASQLDEIFLAGSLRRLNCRLQKPAWLNEIRLAPKERKY